MRGLLVYLDTSSLVKRYIEEEGSQVIDKVYEEAEAGRIRAAFSVWNVGETLGVLDRYHTRNLISDRDLEAALRSLASESMKMIRLNSLQVLPITSENIIESWLLVLRHHIYEADALQISSSKEAGCNLFLGADARLIQAARKEGINALNVEIEPKKALKQITEA